KIKDNRDDQEHQDGRLTRERRVPCGLPIVTPPPPSIPITLLPLSIPSSPPKSPTPPPNSPTPSPPQSPIMAQRNDNCPTFKEPTCFDGGRLNYKNWIQTCKVYLNSSGSKYSTEENKIWYVLSTMQSGEAANWVEQWLASKTDNQGTITVRSLKDFFSELGK